jgi:imidazolonepropionase-like amidohydrolase
MSAITQMAVVYLSSPQSFSSFSCGRSQKETLQIPLYFDAVLSDFRMPADDSIYITYIIYNSRNVSSIRARNCPMKFLFNLFALLSLSLTAPAFAQDAKPTSTLITNVEIFDGRNVITSSGSVRISGDQISQVSTSQLNALPGETVIDGKGRFLMPGLIDAHVHVSWAFSFSKADQANAAYVTAAAVANASAMLHRGFTTVRDTAGTDYGLARAIDEGIVPGPRIIFAGRSISQTGGHADHRKINEEPANVMLHSFGSTIADGKAEVIKAAREELRRGADFIKIHAGGGVSSPTDPLYSVQYSAEEMEAAVQTAADRGTYVAAHAYTPESISRALNAGVKTIEHGNLIDKKTAELAAQKGAFVVPTLTTYWAMDKAPGMPSYIKQKNKTAMDAMYGAIKFLKEAGVKIAFGTDLIADMHPLQNQEFLLRTKAFTPTEILRQATSINGSLIALSGRNNTYGKVGVIEEDAIADMILIDGNPIENIALMTKPETAFSLIIKDGKIVQ